MKKDLGAEPAVYPMPVLMIATYNADGTVDVMNAAWGMNCGSNKIALFINEKRRTTENIKREKAFTVSLANEEYRTEADYFGMISGAQKSDKFECTGMHAEKSRYVNAPVIREFPVVMECELAEIIDTENMYAVVGTIVNTAAEESVLNEQGRMDPMKTNALIFDHATHGYYITGRRTGTAWEDGKRLL